MALGAWQASIVNESGDVQGAASIEVRSELTGSLVSLFEDRDGNTPLGNPFDADANGFARFYVAGGAYRITATKGAFSITWRHVAIGTAGEADVEDYVAAVTSTDNAIARFDGGTGQVQNSANGPFVDDSGRLRGVSETGPVIGGKLGSAYGGLPSNDADDADGLGWHGGTISTNNPGWSFSHLLQMGDNSERFQLAFNRVSEEQVALRARYSGAWSDWVRIPTSGGGVTFTGGFDATEHDAGEQTTGTFTPDPADGNFQKAVNGGAHTLAPPGVTCTMVIQYTNNENAGAITTSGFDVVDGDDLTTTDGDDFLLYITEVNGFSRLTVSALQ